MGNCWDQHTHGTSKTARCRMASTPVRLATQCATNGSNISSNFATDFERLSSVQQRKRSALHLQEILARTERPRQDLHVDVQYVGDGLHSAQRRTPTGWSCSCCNAARAGRVARGLGLQLLVLMLVLLMLFMLGLLLLQLRKAGLSP